MTRAIDDLIAAASKLAASVEYDMNGTAGQGGNGGLLSDQTLRAAGELRLAISRYRNGATNVSC